MKKNAVLVLVDSDGLLYHSSRDSIEESLLTIDEKINNILVKTEATHYALFISQGKYFRHLLFPEYKQNRKSYPTQLKWIKTLKQYLVEKYNAMSMNGVEADDLINYWYNKDLHIADDGKIEPKEVFDATLPRPILFTYEPIEVIVASPDKDILQSLPSKGKGHFNYTYRVTDEAKAKSKENPNYQFTEDDIVKGWWVETSNLTGQCEIFKATQLLMGDATDGVKGLDKVGPVGASKILSTCQDNMDFLIPTVFNEYVSRLGISKGVFEFQKNYRLLHLLDCDEDFIREIRELPQLPHINEVVFDTKGEDLEINNVF